MVFQKVDLDGGILLKIELDVGNLQDVLLAAPFPQAVWLVVGHLLKIQLAVVVLLTIGSSSFSAMLVVLLIQLEFVQCVASTHVLRHLHLERVLLDLLLAQKHHPFPLVKHQVVAELDVKWSWFW